MSWICTTNSTKPCHVYLGDTCTPSVCTQPRTVILIASCVAGASLQAVIKATGGCASLLSDTTNTTQVDISASTDFSAMDDAVCFKQLCLVVNMLCWFCIAHVVKF